MAVAPGFIEMLKCLSPAKINLFLRVLGRRPDGYHDLFSLMCGLDLADVLTFDFSPTTLTVSCKHPGVPDGPDNLAYRAAARFFEQTGLSSGVSITIEKNIPVAAGLGGGSSNAATVLSTLNSRYRSPLSPETLLTIGARLGADVPFFLYGRPALATGIGEILTPYPRLPEMTVLLINPGINISTAEVYKSLNLGLTNPQKKNRLSSFTKETCFRAETDLINDLETVTAARYPEIPAAKERLRKQGAAGVLMSGSGPTVFGLFPEQTTAEAARQALKPRENEWIFLAKLLTGDDAT